MFLILTYPRTGSELLINSLGLHTKLRVESEILNPQRSFVWRDRLFFELFGHSLPILVKEGQLDANTKEHYEVYEQTEELALFIIKAFQILDGFKVMHAHIPIPSIVIDTLRDMCDLKVIFLRRNYLESAISYWFAMKTNKWFRALGERRVEDQPCHIDPNFVKAYCGEARQEGLLYEQLFTQHDVMKIRYEDLILSWGYVMTQIQEFLEIPYEILPKSMEKRLDKPYQEIVSNYAELKALTDI